MCFLFSCTYIQQFSLRFLMLFNLCWLKVKLISNITPNLWTDCVTKPHTPLGPFYLTQFIVLVKPCLSSAVSLTNCWLFKTYQHSIKLCCKIHYDCSIHSHDDVSRISHADCRSDGAMVSYFLSFHDGSALIKSLLFCRNIPEKN